MSKFIMIYQLLIEIRKHIGIFYKLCEDIARLDMLQSLALASTAMHYVRPVFSNYLEVSQARHPLLDFLCSVEPTPNNMSASMDYNLNIITGPNGSGKSIYIRQVVLIQVMAQVGCYVPAESAILRISDRILARVYLEDNMICGASAFVLEIKEIQHFLTVVTKNTLMIVDELCRSTSIEEGTALAMAICEKLMKTSAFIFFTTHFKLITKLADVHFNIKTWQMETITEVLNNQTILHFNYHVIPGVTTLEHYGFFLARGSWPENLIQHAENIFQQLSKLHKKPSSLLGETRLASRLKYNLEAEFKLLKIQKQLSHDIIYEKLFQYSIDLKNLGYNVDLSPVLNAYRNSNVRANQEDAVLNSQNYSIIFADQVKQTSGCDFTSSFNNLSFDAQNFQNIFEPEVIINTESVSEFNFSQNSDMGATHSNQPLPSLQQNSCNRSILSINEYQFSLPLQQNLEKTSTPLPSTSNFQCQDDSTISWKPLGLEQNVDISQTDRSITYSPQIVEAANITFEAEQYSSTSNISKLFTSPAISDHNFTLTDTVRKMSNFNVNENIVKCISESCVETNVSISSPVIKWGVENILEQNSDSICISEVADNFTQSISYSPEVDDFDKTSKINQSYRKTSPKTNSNLNHISDISIIEKNLSHSFAKSATSVNFIFDEKIIKSKPSTDVNKSFRQTSAVITNPDMCKINSPILVQDPDYVGQNITTMDYPEINKSYTDSKNITSSLLWKPKSPQTSDTNKSISIIESDEESDLIYVCEVAESFEKEREANPDHCIKNKSSSSSVILDDSDITYIPNLKIRQTTSASERTDTKNTENEDTTESSSRIKWKPNCTPKDINAASNSSINWVPEKSPIVFDQADKKLEGQTLVTVNNSRNCSEAELSIILDEIQSCSDYFTDWDFEDDRALQNVCNTSPGENDAKRQKLETPKTNEENSQNIELTQSSTKRKKSKFEPPKKLTKKEIEQEYYEQDKKILESDDSLQYVNQILNRPSVKQLQQMKVIASVHKTNDGVVVVPIKEKKTKPKRQKFLAPLKESAQKFDVTLFSDKNVDKYKEFMNLRKEEDNIRQDLTAFQFIESQNVSKGSTKSDCNLENSNTKSPGYYTQNKTDIDNIVNKYLNPFENLGKNNSDDSISTVDLNVD